MEQIILNIQFRYQRERLKIVKRERVMKLKILLFAVMSFSFFWSCDKEEIPVFASNDAGIYFQRLTSTVYGRRNIIVIQPIFLLPGCMLITRAMY